LAPPSLELIRCIDCHAHFAPRAGPCPRCGSSRWETVSTPAEGVVVAATELTAPATGWKAPHRIALIEVAHAVRLLATVEGPLPVAGDSVRVTAKGEGYAAFVVAPGGSGENRARDASVPERRL
jgi:uncharacterized OB-fold protein